MKTSARRTCPLACRRQGGIRAWLDDGKCMGALPVPDHLTSEAAGLRLSWRLQWAERSYVGSFIAWAQIRDGDPDATPPQLRLRDGRTVFISAVDREALRSALDMAAIPVRRRPDVWSDLLEPFLDTDYGVMRATVEKRLLASGLDRLEVQAIRQQVQSRMRALTALTFEWEYFGQADLISTYPRRRLFLSWRSRASYQRFRRWSDAIADRPTAGST